jgi:hypothetical protein
MGELELMPWKTVDLKAFEQEWDRVDVSSALVSSLPLLADIYGTVDKE